MTLSLFLTLCVIWYIGACLTLAICIIHDKEPSPGEIAVVTVFWPGLWGAMIGGFLKEWFLNYLDRKNVIGN